MPDYEELTETIVRHLGNSKLRRDKSDRKEKEQYRYAKDTPSRFGKKEPPKRTDGPPVSRQEGPPQCSTETLNSWSVISVVRKGTIRETVKSKQRMRRAA